MAPRVSIVVPSYNNESYIAETVRSVLAQTYDDFEVVIADHSSTVTVPLIVCPSTPAVGPRQARYRARSVSMAPLPPTSTVRPRSASWSAS